MDEKTPPKKKGGSRPGAGRPRSTRTIDLHIRVTEEESAALDQLTKDLGASRSLALMMAARSSPMWPQPPADT